MIEKTVTTKKEVEIKLTGNDIIKALVDANYINMPKNATCEFQVPGGGDYSNMMVNVDNHSRVIVTFTEEENT